jgi:two-component sensor histidine kinase
MMEVPIISGGRLKGIVCFEHTSTKRQWTTDEQHFAIALSHLLTITIETNAKNTYRSELEKALEEKSLLISEINHRVKNNLAIITAIIRSESDRVKDDFHKGLFDSILSKTYSLASLQEELYRSTNYQELNFNKYIEQLADNMNRTFGANLRVKIIFHSTETILLEVDVAMPMALICSEILNNCFKYAFKEDGVNQLSIFLGKDQNGKIFLSIEDNGIGLPENYLTKGTGFELMNDLAEQIDAQLECLSSSTGTQISLKF